MRLGWRVEDADGIAVDVRGTVVRVTGGAEAVARGDGVRVGVAVAVELGRGVSVGENVALAVAEGLGSRVGGSAEGDDSATGEAALDNVPIVAGRLGRGEGAVSASLTCVVVGLDTGVPTGGEAPEGERLADTTATGDAPVKTVSTGEG